MIRFQWDSAKAESNFKKHGVSFDEAKSVFYDEYAIQFYDDNNSQLAENCFLLLGTSSETRLLLVCHCERDCGESIRIISARKATKAEQTFYRGD